jgi:hypothetical protein
MQMTHIAGPTTPEQVMGSFINKTGAISVVGRVVAHDTVTLRDGKACIQPVTANLSAVIGPMLQAGIADGDPVLVGMHGTFQTLVAGKVGSGGNSNPGDILIPVNAQYHVIFSAASTGLSGLAVLNDAAVAQDAAAALKKVFWRGL